MAIIKLGNVQKEVPNRLFTSVRTDNIDPGYFYTELFGSFPVYRCEYTVHREDEEDEDDEDGTIYATIFNDLMESGNFTPIYYVYGNKRKEKSDDKNNLYANEFFVVSNTGDPIAIHYSYGDFIILSHLGTQIIEETINKYLKKYTQESDSVKCHIIAKDNGLYLDAFKIKVKGDLDLDMYNEGFEDIHNKIVKSLKEDESGLYMLYGAAGTGKTTFIRYLIKECATRKMKFVYVPSNLFCDFTNPNILSFLLNHKGCVFIIEDSEDLVTTVDGVRSTAISDLLNMTDGLLSDAMNIKIICTFNTDTKKIDEALLRPGRCKCKYKFELLDKDRANVVAAKLGLKEVDKDVSLAELFNPDQIFSETKKKKMGFTSAE